MGRPRAARALDESGGPWATQVITRAAIALRHGISWRRPPGRAPTRCPPAAWRRGGSAPLPARRFGDRCRFRRAAGPRSSGSRPHTSRPPGSHGRGSRGTCAASARWPRGRMGPHRSAPPRTRHGCPTRSSRGGRVARTRRRHHGEPGRAPHQHRHLAEIVRDQIALPGGEGPQRLSSSAVAMSAGMLTAPSLDERFHDGERRILELLAYWRSSWPSRSSRSASRFIPRSRAAAAAPRQLVGALGGRSSPASRRRAISLKASS
jgi:hypothetical protein